MIDGKTKMSYEKTQVECWECMLLLGQIRIIVDDDKILVGHFYSYGPLPVRSTYKPIYRFYRVYNPL